MLSKFHIYFKEKKGQISSPAVEYAENADRALQSFRLDEKNRDLEVIYVSVAEYASCL